MLVMGAGLGLLAAFGLAFLADYWRPSFRTPEEVEDYLSIPVLAAIPMDRLSDGSPRSD